MKYFRKAMQLQAYAAMYQLAVDPIIVPIPTGGIKIES